MRNRYGNMYLDMEVATESEVAAKIGLIHTLIDHVTLVKMWLDGFEVSHQGS